MLLENCGVRGQAAHQGQATGNQLVGQPSGNLLDRSHAPVDRRRHAYAAGKQVAEASQAREADLQAHLGDGIGTRGQQVLGMLDPRL